MWRYEICKECGKEQKMVWSVRDYITGKREKILCLECFLKTAKEKKVEISPMDLAICGYIIGDD